MGELKEEVISETEKESLRDFLNQNAPALRALRAYRQIFDSRIHRLDEEVLGPLAKEIKTKSGGVLSWEQGMLCCISKTTEWFGHEILDNPRAEAEGVLRGLYYDFEIGGHEVGCFEIDPGRPLDFFRSLSPDDRQEFIDRFARKRGDSAISLSLREKTGITAFVSVSKSGYQIEVLARHYPLPPRPT